MFCPFCQAEETKVIDSRVSNGTVRRRRECTQCQARFNTKEVVEWVMPRIIKRDDSREAFDEDKLRSGIMKSLEKRPISLERIEGCVTEVMEKIRASTEREVSSHQVGEWVMGALRRLDPVAYVRFASVYRCFSNIQDYRQEIQALEKELGAE